jgi:hypothetical protein
LGEERNLFLKKEILFTNWKMVSSSTCLLTPLHAATQEYLAYTSLLNQMSQVIVPRSQLPHLQVHCQL